MIEKSRFKRQKKFKPNIEEEQERKGGIYLTISNKKIK